MGVTTGTQTQTGRTARAAVTKALLWCGVVGSLLYIATDMAAANLWQGYSYTSQQVSELSAIGAPTRPLWLVMTSLFAPLMIAFGVGVWRSAGRKRSLRIVGILMAVFGVVGWLWAFLAPMHLRGTVALATDASHIVFAVVQLTVMTTFIVLGGVALGGGFRIYSIATIVSMLGAGGFAGTATTAIAAGQPTPWMGLVERVSVYAPMLWIVLFGAALLRLQAEQAAVASDVAAGLVRPTKKVAVLMGSPQKHGATYTASRKFLDNLEAFGDVIGEIVALSDYDIHTCRGCKTCFARGEERCPLKDDRDVLIGKMMDADAVVFASPNYSWHVSGVMKVFLDRLGFAFHRPQFHGKASSAIVVQGIMRGGQIRKYLEFVAGGLGFTVVKGSVMRTLEPMTEKAIQKMEKALAEQARRFHDQLLRPAHPVPSLFALMMFRMGRTGINLGASKDERDWAYYREQGWFESDFYYPTHLGPFKRAAGALFDWAGAHLPVFQVADEAEGDVRPSSSAPAHQ